jgi:hypothetical protein
MNEKTAIELHDSVLERIEAVGGDLVLLLTAYVHRSAGEPAVDPGSGWTQSARLRIHNGRGDASCPVDIMTGSVLAGDLAYENVLPVPFPADGPIRLELQGGLGQIGRFTGDTMSIELTGEPGFIETYPGSGPSDAGAP